MLKSLTPHRNAIRGGILLLICLAAILGFPFSGCYLNIGYLRLLCPAGFFEVALISHRIPWELLPGFAIAMAGLIFMGRIYCGWLCPASFLGEKIKKSAPITLGSACNAATPKTHRFKLGLGDAAAIMLGLFVGMGIFQFPLICLICPLGIVSRNLIQLVSQHTLRLDLLLLLAIPLASALFDFRQAPLCPAGIVRALASKVGFSKKPTVDTARCISCQKCKTACPSHIGPISNAMDEATCLQCLECVTICPEHALESCGIGIKTPRKGEKDHP